MVTWMDIYNLGISFLILILIATIIMAVIASKAKMKIF